MGSEPAGLDFDSYVDAIRVASLTYLKAGPTFSHVPGGWQHGHGVLPGMTVQYGVDVSARIVHGTLPPGTGFVMFEAGSHTERIFIDGEQIGAGEILIIPDACRFTFVCELPVGWFALALPGETIAELVACARVTGHQPDRKILAAISSLDLARLVQGSRLAISAAARGDAQELARCEDELQTLLRTAVAAATCRVAPVRSRAATDIKIGRALHYVEARPHDSIAVEELVDQSEVEYRTLLRVFQAFLRVSPKRYLKLRQLNLVRQSLRRQNADGKATDVMASYGVSEFGRFAAEYRQLFGERPSDTLMRHARPEARSPLVPLRTAGAGHQRA